MTGLKYIKKGFIYLFFTMVVLVVATTVTVYLYQDKLVGQLIREGNKHLLTPVHAEKIEATIWKNFPSVSVALHNVVIEENTARHGILARADLIIVSFSILDLMQGNYVINELHARNGKVSLIIDKNGNPNYQILKPSGKSSGAMVLDLEKVILTRINLNFSNEVKYSEYDLDLHTVDASLQILNNYLITSLHGDITSNYLRFEADKFVRAQDWKVNSDFTYNLETKFLDLTQCDLSNARGSYIVTGNYDFDTSFTELDFEAKDSNIKTILDFLPLENQSKLSKYQSEGDIYLKGKLSGTISSTESPEVVINFGAEKAAIFHPEYQSRLTDVQLTGEFRTKNLNDPAQATIKLTKILCRLEGKTFTGDLSITNFKDPWIETAFTGSMDMHSLFSFYPVERVDEASGSIQFNIDFTGKLSNLKNKSTVDRVEMSGDIAMLDVSVKWKGNKLPFQNLNGSLLFNNSDLALNEVTGNLGNSDFTLNGFFKNIITYLLLDQKTFGIEADLKSDLIDLDELLASTENQLEKYVFRIPAELFLSFDCDVRRLKFRRLDARRVTGKLKVKDQLAVGKDIRAITMGGRLDISGLINAREENHISVNAEGKLTRIDIDSVFYVFENFNQAWLIDKNLKGQVHADVLTEMAFRKDLTFISPEFIADIGISIHNGQLLDFEPMQELSRFVNGEDLSDLRFSDLKNDIHIEDRNIYLPEMDVSSNITSLTLSGTHTFDQVIDYRVIVPLIIKPKMDKDEYFGAVEDDGTGKSKLFLRITGTTSDYKVTYDTEAVKKKIIADLKKEVNDLKAAFKNKGAKKRAVLGLNEDEYFDWDHEIDNRR